MWILWTQQRLSQDAPVRWGTEVVQLYDETRRDKINVSFVETEIEKEKNWSDRYVPRGLRLSNGGLNGGLSEISFKFWLRVSLYLYGCVEIKDLKL